MMTDPVWMALAATTGTWLVTALGAATVLFFSAPKTRVMNGALGFAAGVMIAASFWSLLAPAIAGAETVCHLPPWLVAAAGFLCGALFLWCTDRLAARVRTGGMGRAAMLVWSITLHNIPEGLAVGVAFGALRQSPGTGGTLMGAVSVALGIGLQNFPEGAAVALPLRREGYSRWKSFLIGQLSGLVEPAAGVIGALLVHQMQWALPFALSFAAGAMILVAVHELIPECQQERAAHPYTATACVIAGFAVMMVLDVMLG